MCTENMLGVGSRNIMPALRVRHFRNTSKFEPRSVCILLWAAGLRRDYIPSRLRGKACARSTDEAGPVRFGAAPVRLWSRGNRTKQPDRIEFSSFLLDGRSWPGHPRTAVQRR